MPLFHKLVDYTEMFEHLPDVPIIINYLPNTTEEDRAMIDELIITRYSSDMLSILPSCRCGETKGEYAIGVICDKCRTPVKSKVEEDIKPLVWFKRPEGVAQLINPSMYNMLRDRFKVSGFNVIDWLMDTTFFTTKRTPPILNEISEAGIQRGYNYFVENFDFIIQTLLSMKQYRLKKGKRDELYDLIQKERHAIFSDYIPLPNKSLLIVENTHVGKYIDTTIIGARNAINMLISIDRKFAEKPLKMRENRTAKAISKLADFYNTFTAKNISPKTGLIRRHIIGSRAHFCFRAVITSITRPHRYDDIEVPWFIALTTMREHLLSKMMKMGFSHSHAVNLIYASVCSYHPLIDQLLQDLINETPGKRIPCTLQRNPSLHQGSMLLMGISRFKTDPGDRTISLGILVVRNLNADFDGKLHCYH